MTDTVRLLRTYRKSLVRDDDAFMILSLLYRDDVLTEVQIQESADLGTIEIKRLLRALYQSNLISVLGGDLYGLTAWGQGVLSGLGIDSLVSESLIDEITTGKREAEELKSLVRLCVELEPARAQWVTNSYRNLRNYFVHCPDLELDQRRALLWTSAIHPDSKLRVIVKNASFSHKDIRLWLHEPAVFTSHYESVWRRIGDAARRLDDSDVYIWHSCTSESTVNEFGADITLLSELRMWNYFTSLESDDMLETCLRANDEAIAALYKHRASKTARPHDFLTRMIQKVYQIWSSRTKETNEDELQLLLKYVLEKKEARTPHALTKAISEAIGAPAEAAPALFLEYPDEQASTPPE